MLEQLTEKPWYSPFPQYQVTERPDRTALELLKEKSHFCVLISVCPVLPGASAFYGEQ